ncbi:MAG: response regulator [Hyphomonadaceae bacterium]|nr:response regulator [Hyphomonadaceae bacterium]
MTETPRIAALIVDDNAHMRTIVYTLLHALGVADIRQASDGAEANILLEEWRPDVIIVDQNMQPMNGTAFSRMLRRTSQNCYDTPIIMLTAHTERSIVEAARDAGIDEILAKPISAKALLARLNAVTHERRAFVRAPGYIGPDRRRRTKANYMGPRRREDDAWDEDTYSLE